MTYVYHYAGPSIDDLIKEREERMLDKQRAASLAFVREKGPRSCDKAKNKVGEKFVIQKYLADRSDGTRFLQLISADGLTSFEREDLFSPLAAAEREELAAHWERKVAFYEASVARQKKEEAAKETAREAESLRAAFAYLGLDRGGGGASQYSAGGASAAPGASGLSKGYEHHTLYSRHLGYLNMTAYSLFSN